MEALVQYRQSLLIVIMYISPLSETIHDMSCKDLPSKGCSPSQSASSHRRTCSKPPPCPSPSPSNALSTCMLPVSISECAVKIKLLVRPKRFKPDTAGYIPPKTSRNCRWKDHSLPIQAPAVVTVVVRDSSSIHLYRVLYRDILDKLCPQSHGNLP